MVLEDIIGITNLDATAGIFDEETGKFLGKLSLHQVLRLVLILAGSVCNIWEFILIQTYHT
jgi:hypothetical protein